MCDTSASNRAVQNPTPLEPAEGRGTTILNSAMFHTVIKKGWGFIYQTASEPKRKGEEGGEKGREREKGEERAER